MQKRYRSRMLVVVCVAFAVLLAALAALQYQWSARVALADAQREKEHLDSAASLFADEFNGIIRQAGTFLQNDARAALRSDTPIPRMPEIFADLYYAEISPDGKPTARIRSADGRFEPAPLPSWALPLHCASIAFEQPPALVTPIYEMPKQGTPDAPNFRMVRTTRGNAGQCFVARLDLDYLRRTVFPELIRKSFGGTEAADYDFTVVSKGASHQVLFGAAKAADLRAPFLSVMPGDLISPESPASNGPQKKGVFIVERVETRVEGSSPMGVASLLGPGIWELQVARKEMPLAAAFEQTRRRNLLVSLGVECLLLAAIVFLVVAARRTERLADQKMQFVAGVSHELRTPVSAIAMLSRNQADGLVEGAERVRQYGELIHQQSRRLNEMVEQTLQYAGIRSSLRPPAREALDLKSVIEQAIDARRGELENAGIEVEVAIADNLPQIRGDAAWLRTAIDNLLSNAQKHAGGGRWMRVSANRDVAAKEVQISVEDRGAGIDPADQPEIFEPFTRGRTAIDAQIPGSGLGLSLVRSAVEAHHGTVTLHSAPGRGANFTLHLPV